jgi:hypothetical protein
LTYQEYVCHKTDKVSPLKARAPLALLEKNLFSDILTDLQRIAELIRRKQRQRIKRNMLLEKQLEEGGKIRDKKGQIVAGVPQPTIPVVAFYENEDDMQMRREKTGARPRPGYKQSASDTHLTRHAHMPGPNRTPPQREHHL